MKMFKIKILLAFMALGLFALTACNEDTTNPVTPDKPNAPTNFQATSLSDTKIKLKWTGSTSETNALFAAYVLNIAGDDNTTKDTTIIAAYNPLVIPSLKEGVVYTFTLKAKYTNGEYSDPVTIKWSPATRFLNDAFDSPIQVYEYDSQYGSGLQLYNAEQQGPQVRKSTAKDFWDLGLETRDGQIKFGSASEITFGTGTPSTVEITDPILVNSLDELFDSQALSSKTFSTKLIDLTSASYTGNMVIIARSKQESASWNYAKIFIERVSGGYLQGTAKDRYIKCYISYQMKAGVPYAKIKG